MVQASPSFSKRRQFFAKNGVAFDVQPLMRLFILSVACSLACTTQPGRHIPSSQLEESASLPSPKKQLKATPTESPPVATPDLFPGIITESIEGPVSPTGVGDRVVTVVRVDPKRFVFRFYSEVEFGKRQTMPHWIADQKLLGAINAGMFLPDGRSVGYMQQGGTVLSKRKPKKFESIIAFDGDNVAIGGKGCSGTLSQFIERYDRVLQARRTLVDCQGTALPWKNSKRYSAAAIGIDSKGWVILVHSRTPYRMAVLSKLLAQRLDLRGLVYMEGGPEASLIVGDSVREIGSYEDGFNPNDDNHVFWDLPNVIGFKAKTE